MLIKINQAIKGAGSFTWHVLIPDEGDIRKHFLWFSEKKNDVKWQIKKWRKSQVEVEMEWWGVVAIHIVSHLIWLLWFLVQY